MAPTVVLFAGLILGGLCASVRAQEVPFLVADVNAATRDASPGDLTVSGGSLFFSAIDGLQGPSGGELWKTDGTAAGTVLVKDIVPGSEGSNPRELTDVNGTLFFTVATGAATQLWKSDGTDAGTVGLGGGFFPEGLTHVGASLFFSAFELTNCQELWTSDGTPAGTVLVKDINPGCTCMPFHEGIVCEGHSQPSNLTDVDGTLFFSATDGVNGTELWMSDGTAIGTVMVKDINPGSESSSPSQLTNVNGVLFFAATDPVNGTELWMSDGTAIGTVLVKDVNPGSDGSSPRAFHATGGVLYFRAFEPATGHELWTSNGTALGTTLVADINPGAGGSSPPISSPPSDPIVDVAGTLLFAANDGTAGSELWRSDGTAMGTMLVRDINPGAPSASLFHLTPHGGFVYFRAAEPATGNELWRSDGTLAGTMLVKDLNPGTGVANPQQLTSFAGALFFVASDPAVGNELFRTDGTPGGTTLVLDINTDTLGSAITHLTAAEDSVFFHNADALHGEELWVSDGTAAGTMLVKDIVPGPLGALSDLLCNGGCRERVAMNGVLFFAAHGGASGLELWRSDGTEPGTMLVKDVSPGPGFSRPADLTVLGNTVYFSADGLGGRELWRTDGTPAGTMLVKDINPGGDAAPADFEVLNGTLFFRAFEPATGFELWRSDGTAAGTVLVKDLNPGPADSGPLFLTRVGERICFGAFEPATGFELWRSDGTAAGTSLVKDLVPGPTGTSPRELTDVNGRLFFVASELTNGDEVWTSDGTPAGTFLLKDINPGLGSGFGIFEPTALTSFNGLLFFSAFEPSTQQELWQSDGTSAGTVLVKDIYPGTSGSGPRELRVINGSLYFRAGDPAAGTELWRSDGTTSGTVRVADIEPGTRSSDPQDLTVAGDRLFFTASTLTTGREPWALDPCAPGDLCTGLCGTTACTTILGHTFRVRDPRPGVEAKHRVTIAAREAASPDVLTGNPMIDGATLQVVASGATPTSQTFTLPAGPSWRSLGANGFAYKDPDGTNGAVTSLVLKHRPGSPFILKVRLRGGSAPLGIDPPNPGNEGGLRLRIEGAGGYCVRFGGPAGGRVRNLGAQLFEVVRATDEVGCP